MKGLRRNEDAMKNYSWYLKKTSGCVEVLQKIQEGSDMFHYWDT